MALEDDAVLSFGDVKLWKEDVATLAPGQWIGDNVITFYTEYLTRVVHKGREKVELVQPGTAFFVSFADEEDLDDAGIPALALHAKQLVLVPVNNNADQTVACGGSHWSLLVFDRTVGGWQHYDSAGSENDAVARHLARKLDAFVVKPRADAALPFAGVRCARQRNGFDCGVFTMLFMDVVLGGGDAASLSQPDADKKRADVAAAIHSLAAAGGK